MESVVPKLEFKFREGETVYYYDIDNTSQPGVATIEKGVVGGGFMYHFDPDTDRRIVMLEVVGAKKKISENDMYANQAQAKEDVWRWMEKNFKIERNAKAMGVSINELRLMIKKGEVLEGDLK